MSYGKQEAIIVAKWRFEILIKPMTKSTPTIFQGYFFTPRGYKGEEPYEIGLVQLQTMQCKQGDLQSNNINTLPTRTFS